MCKFTRLSIFGYEFLDLLFDYTFLAKYFRRRVDDPANYTQNTLSTPY